jgi:hypothetical protein
MRYAASEKLEIICTVETSSLGERRTLAHIDILKFDQAECRGFDSRRPLQLNQWAGRSPLRSEGPRHTLGAVRDICGIRCHAVVLG